ncbi:phage integrase SAM-like domain protein [Subdoligranulum variabile DSM 15176]|uniref:Phage integrase SAM-like domain protein n=1 Tax=Subdoligranulum variabile DSM 15176 TaxID=411471 RepID=D1PS85_9FIRM|nr:phage integrase SAM-like domain protein [Subdoligranulum variabile DSM 15176]
MNNPSRLRNRIHADCPDEREGFLFRDAGRRIIPAGRPMLTEIQYRRCKETNMIQELRKYAAYLAKRERSAGTIENYLRNVQMYFAQTPPDKRLSHTAAVRWREMLEQKGYAVASINAMMAAVNGYFVFCGHAECCARPLKVQRRAFCDEDREGISPAADGRAQYTQRAAADGTADAGFHRDPGVGTAVHYGGGGAAGTCYGALQRQMPRDFPAAGSVPQAAKLVPGPGQNLRRGVRDSGRPSAGPLQPLARNESPVQTGRCCVQKSIPAQSQASVRQGFLQTGKESFQAGGSAGTFQHRNHPPVYRGKRQGTSTSYR